MRALLRDKKDSTLIAFEVEEAVYDPENMSVLIFSSSGTSYAVQRIVQSNADSMIRELAENGYCDFTQFEAFEDK